MRVAIVTQSYHPRPGGVTEHVHHTATALRRRGYNVCVVTTNFSTPADAATDAIRIGRNVLVPMNGAWVNMTLGRDLGGQLRRVFEAFEPDVIHTHCPLTPTLPLLSLSVAPSSSRIIGTFHAAASSNLGYRIFRGPLDRMAHRIDTRIAVSPTAQEFAHSYFPGEYTIVPNGVDCRRFSPAARPFSRYRDGKFNVLFVGRMDKRKGLRHLFQAISIIAKRSRRSLRLIVVGDDGPRRFLLPELPRDVELVMTGVVDQSDLPRYFATGDVFCSPATERESFGIVLLEAMASGIPVVGTSIPGYLTLLRHRHNAFVVPPRDAGAIADAIMEIMHNDKLHWTLRNNGLAFARRYDWERVVDRIEAVYRGTRDRERRRSPVVVGKTVGAREA